MAEPVVLKLSKGIICSCHIVGFRVREWEEGIMLAS